mmetsp:Transcript_49009/g.115128  ORF Transcript_49009/g.115128 Transcript_49009/m.115128 type:complete len:426 (+) Transcript_49009:554-1831(+)
MLPPAPPRLSTTTGWPRRCCSSGAMARASRSVVPPGVKGTIRRSGRLGQGASAPAGSTQPPAQAASWRRFTGMAVSSQAGVEALLPAGWQGAGQSTALPTVPGTDSICPPGCGGLWLPVAACRGGSRGGDLSAPRRRCSAGLLHRPAVADDHGLTGQRLGREAGKHQRHLGHIVGRRELTVDGFLEHDLLDDIRFADAQCQRLLGNLFVHQGRSDEAGADDIGPDVVLRTFLGNHLAQADEPMFGRDIGRLEFGRLLGVDRAHVDDGAALATSDHVLHAGAGGQESTVQVDGNHLAPVGVAEVLHRMHDLDAGVAHQDVDAAKVLGAGPHRRVDLGLVADIHPNAKGLTPGGSDFVGGLARSVDVQVGDDHIRALPDIQIGNFTPDATGGAGDECRLAIQQHIKTPSSIFQTAGSLVFKTYYCAK